MEENLKELLKAETDVNKRVNEALTFKNTLLRSIKEKSEKDIAVFRAAKEKEYQFEYEKLRHRIENEGANEGQQEQVDMEVI